MKKFSIILLLLFVPSWAAAVGTVVATPTTYGASNGVEIRTISFAWTSDASGDADLDLSVAFVGRTDSPMEYTEGFKITGAKTIPSGVTAPTDDYNITLVEALGGDRFGGMLLTRDTANIEYAVPQVDTLTAIYGTPPVTETITLTIADAGNAKLGILILYFER